MLNLLLGTDWLRNRDEILNRIAGRVREKQEGLILMVPELISHDMERRLCASAGDTASRYAQVLSFTRLVRSVSEWCQIQPEPCLDSGGRLIAMAAAARSLSSKLKSYASVETRPEFLSELVNAVDEFKRCCVSSADLMGASVRCQGTLAQKLEELSLILERYNGICANGLRDPRDQLDWLLDELECSDYAARHSFYIDGFPDFSRQNLAILEHFIRESPDVTVSLCCDGPGSGRAAFENAGKTASHLKKMAQAMDVPVNITVIPSGDGPLSGVCSRLFEGSIHPDETLRERVFPLKCDSVFEECLVAAERVMDLVAGGSRYRDIGIVCAAQAQYRDVLSLVFRRCAIPVYLSGTDDILEKTAISTVLSALDAAMEGFSQPEVLRYFKSILSGVDPEICDRIENYAVIWGIRGEKWIREWTMHPSGLKDEWTEEDRELLARLNEARNLGITPLLHLRQGLRDAENVRMQVDAVYGFLEEIRMPDNLEALAAEADAMGDNRTAQEYQQLWEILLSALEQLSDMLGESHWENENFERLFRLLLSQYDVGTIPTVLDCVTVGEPAAMRCQQVKHLIVLGALEGQMPGYAGYFGILTDQDRQELDKLGVFLTGGAMENVATEFMELYGCFCGATQSMMITCPPGQTAFVYRRICTMLGLKDGTAVHSELGPALADPAEAGAYLAKYDAQSQAGDMGLAREFEKARSRIGFSLGTVDRENIQKLYGKKLRLSASQIDTQAECRLSYFLQYGLRAEKREEITIDPAEFGTFVHSVLEQTAKKVRDLGGFSKVGREETLAMARDFASDYAKKRFSQLDSQRMAYLFHRNGKELDAVVGELWKELSQAKFEPVAFELGFDAKEKMPAVQIPGKTMDAELRGYVDRVDTFRDGFRNFFRVVDYKTGKKSFDYCDVYNGVGLQMLLYLFALEQGGQKILGERPMAAGVQYFPARYPYLTEDGRLTEEDADRAHIKELRRQGLILNDETVIQAMDPGEDLSMLGCRRKADGTLVGDLADASQFRLLREYLFLLLEDMVDMIAAGNVDPNPYTRGSAHDACRFCPFGAVCARKREEGRRNYKTMSSTRFWEEIERKVKEHGK